LRTTYTTDIEENIGEQTKNTNQQNGSKNIPLHNRQCDKGEDEEKRKYPQPEPKPRLQHPPIVIQLLYPMNHQSQPQAGTPNGKKFGLFVFIYRKNESNPKGETGGVARHRSVCVVQALDYPGGCAMPKLFQKGTADVHQFRIGRRKLWRGSDDCG
jgi:hypothetical protein